MVENTDCLNNSELNNIESDKTPAISVLIPCYNVEKYIEQCIDSVLKQSFKDFEIVCVDDGSKDSTRKIIKELSNKDSRIRIIEQENKGVAAARNTCLKNARGKYIAFIDSDDWIDENYLENLYNAIVKNDCDIAAATIIRKKKYSQKYRVHYIEEKVYETLEDKIKICKVPVCCYLWNKLYRSELVKNELFEDGRYFEDVLWLPNVLKKSKRLVTVPDINYYYRANSGSIVKKPSQKKQSDSYYAHKYMAEFFEENNLKIGEKYKKFTKSVIYVLNIPIARIKEVNGWDIFYLFNLIPLFKYSKTRYRNFYKIFGLKFTIRKNKKSIEEIRKDNEPYENGSDNLPKVISKHGTLEKLINSNCSMCRYGDGEFNLIFGENLPFQNYNKFLAKRLSEILKSNDENILVCVPDVFNSMKEYTQHAADFWRKFVYYNRKDVLNLLDLEKTYYDTEVTRPYMDVADKSVCKKYFEDFKKVWEGKSLVIVEGEASRLGMGNDLFKNAKSIKRILCPAKNSYSEYENILNECLKMPEDSLFIIALGPTATILAYDLAKNNRRALDSGHIDVEYEWFLMGVTEKVPIKDKYVNECRNGKVITQTDDKEYLSQIAANFSERKE